MDDYEPEIKRYFQVSIRKKIVKKTQSVKTLKYHMGKTINSQWKGKKTTLKGDNLIQVKLQLIAH